MRLKGLISSGKKSLHFHEVVRLSLHFSSCSLESCPAFICNSIASSHLLLRGISYYFCFVISLPSLLAVDAALFSSSTVFFASSSHVSLISHLILVTQAESTVSLVHVFVLTPILSLEWIGINSKERKVSIRCNPFFFSDQKENFCLWKSLRHHHSFSSSFPLHCNPLLFISFSLMNVFLQC